MSEMEERLNALLSNPQLMQQIASMAQAMGSQPAEEPTTSTKELFGMINVPATIFKSTGLEVVIFQIIFWQISAST